MRKLNWCERTCVAALLCAATVIAAHAQTFTTLVNFDGSNGALPEDTMALVQGLDGNLYGTTMDGGASGEGTVFRVTSSGAVTILHSFCSQPGCPDGNIPYTGLVLGADENFYGTTPAGGASYDGTLFKITAAGVLTTLHSFSGPDGIGPEAALVQGGDGNFYGTTGAGGANNEGTVFKITPAGTLNTLHSFEGTDGCQPTGPLIQATDGNFYGMTVSCGTNNDGTVFKITPNGVLTTLHDFDATDGANPIGALVQAKDGDFYGATFYGGANSDCYNGGFATCGTIFKVTPNGTLTTLHDFDGADGAFPVGLVQANDGSFFGATQQGRGDGTLFRITPGGALTTLHSFDYTDGFYANPLAQGTSGAFYGTTFEGGANQQGTIFSLAVGLDPMVETVPTAGKAGQRVLILGTNLTGATRVAFNGAPAMFAILSPSLIKAVVPAGATTGPVKVTTPSGTLSSNVPFRVQ
jgi:uncharacterized repeat protein (TIGR03803 family)